MWHRAEVTNVDSEKILLNIFGAQLPQTFSLLKMQYMKNNKVRGNQCRARLYMHRETEYIDCHRLYLLFISMLVGLQCSQLSRDFYAVNISSPEFITRLFYLNLESRLNKYFLIGS